MKFRVADSDTDYYLVIAKIRERIAVGKQTALRFDRREFNLRKLMSKRLGNSIRLNFTIRVAGLENVKAYEDVNKAWENIKENIQISAEENVCVHELKQNKPWVDEECLGFWIKGWGLKCSGHRIQDKAM